MRRAVRFGVVVSIALGAWACATQFQLPSPVPAPAHGFVFPASGPDVEQAIRSSLRALGLSVAFEDKSSGALLTGWRPLEGNDALHRTRGIGRLTLDRDLYSAGRVRLQVAWSATDAKHARVRVRSELQARLERRADIHYESPAGAEERRPDSDRPDPSASGDWVALRSNGVAEDEFFAALSRELSTQVTPEAARP